MRTAPVIELSSAQRSKLQCLGSSRSASIKVRERSAIILLAADGRDNKMISVRLGHDQNKGGRWRKRFASGGIEAILKDKSRPGRIPPVSDAVRLEIISLTIESKPAGSTHWSRGTMARKVGVSESTVGRVWAANGLKPHRVKIFKLSNDKRFKEKLDDIVGLDLSPTEHTIVLSCDENSRIQALDRAQPGLPLKKGRCETMTHDYKRNGTTSLFAALDVASGRVIGKCMS